MSRALSRLLLVALVLALAACAGRAPPRLDAGEHERAQREREAWIAAQQDWSLHGRLAVSDGEDSGSGQLDWEVSPAQTRFEFRAPVSRRAWRLIARPGHAVLEGLDDGPRHGSDAARLLEETIGWSLPLADLAAWARGARGDGPALIEYAASGLPARIIQAGWTIEYRDWHARQTPPLPRRVFAQRGEQRVRLVVESWNASP